MTTTEKPRFFLSCSTTDLDEARRVCEKLESRRYEIFLQSPEDGAENPLVRADAVLLLVDSGCAEDARYRSDLEEAERQRKPVFPVFLRMPFGGALPEPLWRLNCAIVQKSDGPGGEYLYRRLSKKLEIAAVWLRELRQLEVRAARWEQMGRAEEALLSTDALAWTEERLELPLENFPALPERFIQFLEASRARIRAHRAARQSLQRLAQHGFAVPAKIAVSEGRSDEALRLMAAGALLSDDPSFTLDAETEEPNRFALWRAALKAVQDSSLAVLSGHKDPICNHAFSADGSCVITSSEGGVGIVWDAKSGEQIAVLHGHDSGIEVAICNEGRRALTLPQSDSVDPAPRLWDARSGAQIAALRRGAPYRLGRFCAGGRRLLTHGAYDNYLRIWDAGSGREIASWRGKEHRTKSIAFNADSSLAIIRYADHSIRLWDANSGKEAAHLREGDEVEVSAFAISADGERAIKAYGDNSAGLFDIRAGADAARLLEHEAPINAAAFSPDGAYAITASEDGAARLWNGRTGAKLAILRGHEAGITHLLFSSDGTQVVTGSKDKTVRIWNVPTGKERARLQGHEGAITSLAIDEEDTRVVTAAGKTARLWNLKSGALIAVLAEHGSSILAMRFSTGGRFLVSQSDNDEQRIWRSEDGAPVSEFTDRRGRVSADGLRILIPGDQLAYKFAHVWDSVTCEQIAILRGHEYALTNVQFFASGLRAMSGAHDNTLRVWDTTTGKELVTLRSSDGAPYVSAISPDGTRAISISDDNDPRLWDLEAGAEIAVLKVESKQFKDVAVTPDGKTAITISKGGSAQLWNLETCEKGAVLWTEESEIECINFSPGSRFAIAGLEDGRAKVWEIGSGNEVCVLRGPQEKVTSAAISPDGSKAIVVSNYKTQTVWDLQTVKQIATLTGETKSGQGSSQSVYAVVFSPDSQRVFCSSSETVRVWDLQNNQVIAAMPMSKSKFFPPDGTRGLIRDGERARLVDLATSPEIISLKAHAGIVRSVALSADGALAYSSGLDGQSKKWDAETGSHLAILRTHEVSDEVLFSSDGTRAINGATYPSGDHAPPQLWDTATGVKIKDLPCREKSRHSAAFSPAGLRAINASNGFARIWNAENGAEAAMIEWPESEYSTGPCAVSAEGSCAAVCVDRSLMIFDFVTGARFKILEPRFSPKGHKKSFPSDHAKAEGVSHMDLTTVALSPDGRRIVTVLLIPGAYNAGNMTDFVARVFDAQTGEAVSILSGHEGGVQCVAFNSTGVLAITGSDDATARLWDVETGAELAVLQGHDKSVTCAAFSLDGSRAITGCYDGTVRIWDIRRWTAFDGDRALFLAAALDCGLGACTAKERSGLLMQDAPEDLFASLTARLSTEQRARLPELSRRQRQPLHSNCYVFRTEVTCRINRGAEQ
jgi:WD40 repeat protein